MREQGTGRTEILAYHIIQSFKPEEITPEQALAVSEELCDRYLKGNFQYVLAVHSDKDHIHTHIIVNNTNVYNGLSFTYEENQGGRRERAWAKLRAVSDDLCREHNLSVIAEPEKGHSVSHFERDMQKQGKSWKDKLRARIAEVAFYSKNFDDFLDKCPESGIEVSYTPTKKVKLKFRLKDEGQQRFTRADTLGEDYTAERIAEQIEQMQKGRTAIERLAEKKNAEKPVAPPTPVVTPKTEPKPTPTAPTKPTEYGHLITNAVLEKMKERGIAPVPAPKPTADKTDTAKQDYVYKPTSDEEFFNAFGVHLDEVDTPDTTAPTENQAPEVEEVDPWEKFRELGYSDKDIETLESGGIMSFDELHGFMSPNTKHPQDHRKEIADLKEQISDLETLISNIKRKNELAPTHKKYESKSGWFKTQYKKKHNDDIYDYSKAKIYIQEHIDKYKDEDGNAPTLKDLQTKLKDLKDKLKPLVKENAKYEAKTHLAYPYIKKMRHNQMAEQNRRAAERSRQRTQTQQKKKKNYLE